MNKNATPPQRVLQSVSGSVAADWHQHSNGGGWLYKTACVNTSAYLHPTSIVFGDARVYGDAQVSGDAQVYGNAQVSGNAQVYGNAQVSGNAWVCSPFYLQGSRHALTLASFSQIAIGCHIHDIEYWLKNYKAIGKSEGYTKEEISEYGDHLAYIAKYAERFKKEGAQ